MNKIIVIKKTEKLSNYFSSFSHVFDDFDGELIFFPMERMLDAVEYIDSKNLFIIEFTERDEINDCLQKFVDKQKANIYLAVDMVIFSDESTGFKDICLNNEIFLGWIDVSIELEYHIPFFKTQFDYMQSEKNILKLATMGKKLGNIVGSTLAELQRVKNMHEQVVPLRSEQIKGVQLLSKYAAGEKPGGDFFDIITGRQNFYLLMTSSSSYVISSIILAHFELLKEKKEVKNNDIEEFIIQIEKEIKQIDFSETEQLSLLFVKVDLKKMRIIGKIFGEFELISNMGKYCAGNTYPVSNSFFNKAVINLSLDRGEKIVILSPGIRYNIGEVLENGNKLENFIREMIESDGKKFLNELFYNLSKKSTGELLNEDASAIFLEVNENVIMQI